MKSQECHLQFKFLKLARNCFEIKFLGFLLVKCPIFREWCFVVGEPSLGILMKDTLDSQIFTYKTYFGHALTDDDILRKT